MEPQHEPLPEQNPFHLEGTVDRRLWGLLDQVGGERLPGWADVRIFHIPKSLICYAFLPCCPVATPLCPDSAHPEFCNNFAEFFSLLYLFSLLLCCSFFVLCPFFVAPKRKSATLSCKVLERAGQPTVFSLGSAGGGKVGGGERGVMRLELGADVHGSGCHLRCHICARAR